MHKRHRSKAHPSLHHQNDSFREYLIPSSPSRSIIVTRVVTIPQIRIAPPIPIDNTPLHHPHLFRPRHQRRCSMQIFILFIPKIHAHSRCDKSQYTHHNTHNRANAEVVVFIVAGWGRGIWGVICGWSVFGDDDGGFCDDGATVKGFCYFGCSCYCWGGFWFCGAWWVLVMFVMS